MRLLLLIAVSILFSSCSSVKETGNDNPDPEHFNNSSKSVQELNSVQEQGNLLPGITFEVSLYRDLMPSTDINEKHGLIAIIKLVFSDSLERARIFKAYKIWVIKGKSVWEALLIKNDIQNESGLEFYAKDGPGWKPDQKVDVVIESTGVDYSWFIKIKNIPINEID